MSLMSGEGDLRPVSLKLTYDDFLLFPDDGKRHELIDGEHYVTPSPNTRHQTIALNLTGLMWSFLQAHPIGRLFFAPFDIVFSRSDVVEPDLLYMSNERAREILTEKHVTGAPELLIEISSKGTRKRDETLKRSLYERSGVAEYWTVDPDVNAVRVHRLLAGKYQHVVELTLEHGDVLTTPILPGLELPLAKIFERAE
jgi:Uma2 family endonuclease